MSKILGPILVWDNHGCMPLRPEDSTFLPLLYSVRDAGISIVTLNLAYGRQGAASAAAMAASFTAWIADRADSFMLVGSAEDVRLAHCSGRLGICFDLEGMEALDGRLANIERFYRLGVRWMLAAYNQPGIAGGGCLSEDDDKLTPFGRDAIAEMNRLGMVCCATHCGYRTAREMIDVSAHPVIFSHSNPRAVWDHPRNIPDDLMMACARRGGVIGINGFGPFLGQNDASIETYIAHVEYALDLVGDDHVGIALDYVFDRTELDELIRTDPDAFPPAHYAEGAKMIEPWRLPAIAERLHDRGHSPQTLAKLFGGNHLRIAEQVWGKPVGR
nr:membrane dipeptidase [Sphingomonas sp. Y57]